MANFEFGIGISVDGTELASKAIGSVIADVQGLQNSMVSAAGVSLDQIFKGIDPSLLMPANEAIEDAANSLREIKGLLVGMAGGMNAVNVVLNEAPKPLEEVKASLEEVHSNICAMNPCIDDVKTGLEEVKTSTTNWKEVLDDVPGLMGSIGEQTSNIHRASSTLTGLASELEYASVRTEAALGKSRDAAMDFGTAALETANRTRVAWEDVARLQVALRGVSVEFDTTTEAGRKQLDTMVLLSESFGMSQEEVASLAGTMKATGGSLEELAGIGVAFQTQFKVPGLLNQMPVAAKAAMDAQATFGTLVGKSAKDITVNIMRMSGTYAKALGVTAAEATQKAMATFQKFTAEIESYEDLFLGLADDFSPLQTAFLETGMGLEDLQDLMKKGQEDPAAFAEEVKKIRDSMDPQMGERFFRQVMRNTDEATRALLTQEEAAAAASEASSGAGVVPDDPSAVFLKVADAMRETAGDALKQQDALKGVMVEMGKLAASEGVRKGVDMVNDVLQSTNEVLLDQWNQLRHNTAAMETFTNVIGGATAALNGLSVAGELFGGLFSGASRIFMGVAGAAGMLLKPVLFLLDKFRLLGGAAGAGGASAGLGGFAKILGKIALPIGIAIAAFDNVVAAVKGIGAIMSDPSKSGMDKFKGVVGEVLGAVWGTFNDFFFGLPGKVMEGFTNMGKSVSTEGSENFGKAVGQLLAGGGMMLAEFWTTTVYPALGTLWTNIAGWFESRSWQEILLDPLIAVVGGFAAIGDQIIGFFKGVGVGVLEAFGLPAESLAPTFEIVFLKVMKVAEGAINWISDSFMAAVSGWRIMFENFGFQIDNVMSAAAAGMEDSFLGFIAGALEGMRQLSNAAIAQADALGLPTAAFDAFRDKVLEGEAAIATERRDNRAEAAATLAEDKKAHDQRVGQIIGEQEAREKASADIAAGYDAAIAERQGQLNSASMRGIAPGMNATSAPSVGGGALPSTPSLPLGAGPVLGALPESVVSGESVAQVASRAGGSGSMAAGSGSPADRAAQMLVKTLLEVTVNATPGLNKALAESLSFMQIPQNSQGAVPGD
jgi:hypothetical protein